jgi:hypothetical protein
VNTSIHGIELIGDLHNKQESTTFIHMVDKEEFHGLFGVVQGWFSAKLGSKSQ